MYSVIKVFTLLTCLVAYSCAGPTQSLGESRLLQAMRSTSDLQKSNPALTLECFQYYSEVFDQLLQQYEQEFQACQNTSQLQIAELDDSYKPVVNSLNASSVSACHQIDNCNSNNQLNSFQSLACYSDVGNSDAKVMYNISNTANMYYSQLEQHIQMIEFTEEQCTNASKRNYEAATDQAYVNLQGCLVGGEPVPTKATPTTSNATRKTTKAVTTTTVAAPVRTTSVSSTTTPVPVTRPSVPTKTTKTTSVPLTTTSALVAPTTSSAPSLSSQLKKFLNSLRHKTSSELYSTVQDLH